MAHQVLKLLQQKPQQCGDIKTFNKYLLLVTDDNDSIRNEKPLFAQHYYLFLCELCAG